MTSFRVANVLIMFRLLCGLRDMAEVDRHMRILFLDQHRMRCQLFFPNGTPVDVDIAGYTLDEDLPVGSTQLFSVQAFLSWIQTAIELGWGLMSIIIEFNPNADEMIIIPPTTGQSRLRLQTDTFPVDDLVVAFDEGLGIDPRFGILPQRLLYVLHRISNIEERSTGESDMGSKNEERSTDTGREVEILLLASHNLILFRLGDMSFPLHTGQGTLEVPTFQISAPHTQWTQNFRISRNTLGLSRGKEWWKHVPTLPLDSD
ncbi:hypothetical protein SLEP1_g46142 [Rubroshorea leprosula]|uniref:Uncharacterized protein n=1 Tax=Rubroshorea leprosula TaxID=152421 RepID=A0AAV5LLX7_9ROSI|nr:hypothetical protein SLEP1_g46142 [Rubroshorea leprosula]